mmetsp:Transcript_67344/g.146779  ORF Transcript_67344/g.146779 Transcript_67344/m.146779 type:complete len:193 (-) Transcript_67344:180-758(-)
MGQVQPAYIRKEEESVMDKANLNLSPRSWASDRSRSSATTSECSETRSLERSPSSPSASGRLGFVPPPDDEEVASEGKLPNRDRGEALQQNMIRAQRLPVKVQYPPQQRPAVVPRIRGLRPADDSDKAHGRGAYRDGSSSGRQKHRHQICGPVDANYCAGGKRGVGNDGPATGDKHRHAICGTAGPVECALQ